jgi:hypothetical protein
LACRGDRDCNLCRRRYNNSYIRPAYTVLPRMNKKVIRNLWLILVTAVLLGIMGVTGSHVVFRARTHTAEPCQPTPQDPPVNGQDAMSIHL